MEWICLPTGPAASFGYMLERTILEFVSPPIVKRGQRLSVWNGGYADAGTLHQPMVLSSSASTPPGNTGVAQARMPQHSPTYAGHILPDHKSFYISLCPIIRSIYGLLLILRYRPFYISDEM